jgi:glutathione peroxidase
MALGIFGVPIPTLADEKDQPPPQPDAKAESVYDFTVKDIDGKPVRLSRYEGQVLLIVNVASQCGLTDRNYRKLQPLYKKYRERGLRILAFPANNFGKQEPGTSRQIKELCTGKYQATYDLFAKVSVAGEDKCPLYRFLTEKTDEKTAGKVEWNFQKYLVGRDGTVRAHFHPRVDPDDEKLTAAIEEALGVPTESAEKSAGPS